MKRRTYICEDCRETVTVVIDGADITYSTQGSSITIHREGAETLLGRLNWGLYDRTIPKIFRNENKCPACKPFGLFFP